MILQTGFPEASLDLLDSHLNCRYTSVLEATDWTGLKAHATIQTVAAYQSIAGGDTVTLTVGSNVVAGAGTAWTDAITGQNIYRPGDTTTYVATYVSAVALTLDRPYEGLGVYPPGAVYAGTPYVFMTNVYDLPADLDAIVTLLNPISNLPMTGMTKDELDRSAGPRTLVANPRVYAETDDSAEPAPPGNAPPVLRQLELYPPPVWARGYPLEYLRNPYPFDGSNTSRSPLPFVTDKVLLEGVRSDLSTGAETLRYEASFGRELARMLLVEHAQRRVKAPVRMADRFTRHRLGRVLRGYARPGGMPSPPTSEP